jgi:hypothetical protein
MVLGLLTLKCNMNRDLKNLIPWGKHYEKKGKHYEKKEKSKNTR